MYISIYFGHPEVYILIFKGFGLTSQIIMNERGEKEIFGNLRIIYAVLGIFRIYYMTSSYIYLRITRKIDIFIKRSHESSNTSFHFSSFHSTKL